MHEGAIDALGQRVALDAFRVALATRWPLAIELDAAYVASRFPNRALIAGWKLPATATGGPCDLLLLLRDLFPASLPLVALVDVPPSAAYPHVEGDGSICLVSSGTLMELPVDIRHAEHLIDEAVSLMTASFAGSNRDEFLDEISTYWTLGITDVPNPLWYLPSSPGGTSLLYALDLKDAMVLSESDRALKAWVSNYLAGAAAGSIIRGAIIRLPSPIYPEHYPSNTSDLMSLVETAGQDAVELIADTVTPGHPVPLILTFEHHGKQLVLGMRVDTSACIGSGYGKSPFWKGFRKGHLPADEFGRRWGAAKFAVKRSPTVRVDSDFLLNRTAGPAAAALGNMRIAVIGCGALGGQVALLLAQAGIRRMTLVDGELFSWQNMGRHVLPSQAIRRFKALQLREQILLRFPDYDVVAIDKKWQDAWKSSPDVFDKHDLVISLTADWPSDELLNRLSKQTPEIPAAIFSWLEAHGLAAHVVTVLPDGGCLRCLTDEAGAFQRSVADVPARHALQREASCGDFYQPFSAASVAPVAAQVIKSAINALLGRQIVSEHRIWIGAREDFDAVEAAIKPTWLSVLTDGGYERVYKGTLPPAAHCPVCQRVSV